MSKKNLWIPASTTFIIVLLVPAGLLEKIISAGTQADEDQVAVLEGLKGVSVEVVQPVSGFEEKPKFNPVKVDGLHGTVARPLAEARIQVLDDPPDDPQIGHVVVTVNVWKGKLSIDFIVQVKVELYQRHGLRVAFRGVRRDRSGIPFPGVWVELTRIVKL